MESLSQHLQKFRQLAQVAADCVTGAETKGNSSDSSESSESSEESEESEEEEEAAPPAAPPKRRATRCAPWIERMGLAHGAKRAKAAELDAELEEVLKYEVAVVFTEAAERAQCEGDDEVRIAASHI